MHLGESLCLHMSVCLSVSICVGVIFTPCSCDSCCISYWLLPVLSDDKCLTIGSQSKGSGSLCLLFADFHEAITPTLHWSAVTPPIRQCWWSEEAHLAPGFFDLGSMFDKPQSSPDSLAHPILHWLSAKADSSVASSLS